MFGCNEDEDVTSFIDKRITCERPSGEQLGLLVNRQIHRHCKTSRKRSKKAGCRFNFPQPPVKSTSILYPLGNDMSHNEIKKYKDMWKDTSKEITFEQLLINLNVTDQNYCLAI